MASTVDRRSDNDDEFFDHLVRCETRLYNALDNRLREQHGIVTSQFEFLRFVRDHPDARVADIAAFGAIGIGATSKGIDRLEARGWVERRPNPTDRRSSLLGLTPAGTALVTDAELTFAGQLGALVGNALSPAQLAAASEALSVLRTALERDNVGAPIG